MVLKILVYTFGAGGWGLAVWGFCELHQPNLPQKNRSGPNLPITQNNLCQKRVQS